jgi:hypothetical protein
MMMVKKEKGRVSQSNCSKHFRVADLRPACNQKSDFSILCCVCANHPGGTMRTIIKRHQVLLYTRGSVQATKKKNEASSLQDQQQSVLSHQQSLQQTTQGPSNVVRKNIWVCTSSCAEGVRTTSICLLYCFNSYCAI